TSWVDMLARRFPWPTNICLSELSELCASKIVLIVLGSEIQRRELTKKSCLFVSRETPRHFPIASPVTARASMQNSAMCVKYIIAVVFVSDSEQMAVQGATRTQQQSTLGVYRATYDSKLGSS